MGSSVRLRGVKVLVSNNGDGVQIKFETQQPNFLDSSIVESRVSGDSVYSAGDAAQDRTRFYKFLPGAYAESVESGYNEVVQ